MPYILLGAVALAFFVWVTGGRAVFKRREWRFLSAALAIVAFAGAAFAAMRGAWEPAIVLIVIGLWSAAATKPNGVSASPSPKGGMSLDDARSVLGVTPEATPEEIQAAYTRLMRMAHPDKGGTSGLAAQLNAARDRLLR